MITGKSTENLYGIRAVTERTGLSAPNLRMWEKRYEAVVPERTETNRRLYKSEDVERLVLLKKLTDHGHSISRIANLELSSLQALANEIGVEKESEAVVEVSRSRVTVVGEGLVELLSDLDLFEADVVRTADNLEAAAGDDDLPEVDLLIVEVDSMFLETMSALRQLVERSDAKSTLVVYRFASSKTVTALAKTIEGVQLLKAPVSGIQLRREALVLLNAFRKNEDGSEADKAGPVPERLYDADQLARLSRISTTIECECPQHLAELLKGLAAFEKYSLECEDRNADDALLHSFLHRTTAHVRRSMEEALRHLIRTEGITLK